MNKNKKLRWWHLRHRVGENSYRNDFYYGIGVDGSEIAFNPCQKLRKAMLPHIDSLSYVGFHEFHAAFQEEAGYGVPHPAGAPERVVKTTYCITDKMKQRLRSEH